MYWLHIHIILGIVFGEILSTITTFCKIFCTMIQYYLHSIPVSRRLCVSLQGEVAIFFNSRTITLTSLDIFPFKWPDIFLTYLILNIHHLYVLFIIQWTC